MKDQEENQKEKLGETGTMGCSCAGAVGLPHSHDSKGKCGPDDTGCTGEKGQIGDTGFPTVPEPLPLQLYEKAAVLHDLVADLLHSPASERIADEGRVALEKAQIDLEIEMARDEAKAPRYREVPWIRTLLETKAEMPVRVFLKTNMRATFGNQEDLSIYVAEDGKIIAEAVRNGRTYAVEFLFYEDPTPKSGGMLVRDDFKHKIWVVQATSGWVEFFHKMIHADLADKSLADKAAEVKEAITEPSVEEKPGE